MKHSSYRRRAGGERKRRRDDRAGKNRITGGVFSFESESVEMFQRLASSRTAARVARDDDLRIVSISPFPPG